MASKQTKDFKHFFALESLPEAGRKTATYGLVNRSSGLSIGVVKWYGSWRQFCFFPHPNTVWSAGCLKDVADVLRWAGARRKEAANETRE